MRHLVRKSRFKKDFKKLLSSGKDLEKLALVIQERAIRDQTRMARD